MYGTLRRAARQPAFRYLADAGRLVGEGTVAGTLHDLGPYAGAVARPARETGSRGGAPGSASEPPRGAAAPDPDTGVRGEMYRLADQTATLTLLDVHEGCGPDDEPPYEFERAVTVVRLTSGEKVRAWIYWYRRPVGSGSRVASGDWPAR